MAERDRFELDLATALLVYLEGAPTQVRPLELARHFAAAHPHRRAGIGHWRMVTVPRLAWILLLAALLTALLAGALSVGSQLQRRVPAIVAPVVPALVCPPGSAPDAPGPVDQARPFTPEMWAFDRGAGRLVTIAGAETWTFDVCTNTWARMQPNLEPAGLDPTDRLVYDVDSGVTIAVGWNTGRVWAYDLAANTWTAKRDVPVDRTLWAYDPVSGDVVATDNADAAQWWAYDVETDTWSPIRQANGPGLAEFAYDASVDRIVAYAFGAASVPETWLLDLRTGAWSRSDAVTPGIVAGWGLPHSIVYDESAERTAIVSNSGLAAYDATADDWVFVVGGDPGSVPDLMTYDSVNERLIGPGPTSNQGVAPGQGGVVAFDLLTREWTVLLGPSEP
jgi:hypothetical protein